MSKSLLYPIADALEMSFRYHSDKRTISGKGGHQIYVFGQKHTLTQEIVAGFVADKFAVVGVKIAGHLGVVAISEAFENSPVTLMFVNLTKINLVEALDRDKVQSALQAKQAVAGATVRVLEREFYQNNKGPWTKVA